MYVFETMTICIFKAWSFRRNCLVFLVRSWINGTTQTANRLLQGSELILLMILHLTYFWYENIAKIYNFYSQNKKYSGVERVCVATKNITDCKIISLQQSHNVIVFAFFKCRIKTLTNKIVLIFWTYKIELKVLGLSKLFYKITRSTQRAQTSLAEADHYSHIAHCKNVEPWLWKTTHPPKNHYLHHDLGVLPLLCCFFAHLLILQYPDHHQNLISSSLYYSGPVHKFHPNPFITFWVMLFTDKQTDRQTNATKNITSFAKEVINNTYLSHILRDGRRFRSWRNCTVLSSVDKVMIFTVKNREKWTTLIEKCWSKSNLYLYT